MTPSEQKAGLPSSSRYRWGDIANFIVSQGGSPVQAGRVANGMTRGAVERRLQSVKKKQYVQEG